jgi:hypothetical protein
VLLSVSLIYVAGMYLNDAFDRDYDAAERPTRPIPSGEVSAGDRLRCRIRIARRRPRPRAIAVSMSPTAVRPVRSARHARWPRASSHTTSSTRRRAPRAVDGRVPRARLLLRRVRHRAACESTLIAGMALLFAYITG